MFVALAWGSNDNSVAVFNLFPFGKYIYTLFLLGRTKKNEEKKSAFSEIGANIRKKIFFEQKNVCQMLKDVCTLTQIYRKTANL